MQRRTRPRSPGIRSVRSDAGRPPTTGAPNRPGITFPTPAVLPNCQAFPAARSSLAARRCAVRARRTPAHLTLARNQATGGVCRIARYVDQPLVTARVVEAEGLLGILHIGPTPFAG